MTKPLLFNGKGHNVMIDLQEYYYARPTDELRDFEIILKQRFQILKKQTASQ